MTSIALYIENPIFRRAIAESLASFGEIRTITTLSEAIGIDVLLVDNNLLEPPYPSDLPPLVFAIGEASIDAPITESFPKPLRLGHLQARLQLHLAALKQGQETVLPLGTHLFHVKQRQIIRADGKIVRLTEKEALLLAHLLQLTTPVSKEDLLATIWGYDASIDTRTLETHIYRLRALPDMQDIPGWRELILARKGFYTIDPHVLSE